MGTSIIPVSTKFFNQFKNGVLFGDNLSDFTLNLTGSVKENIKVLQQIDIDWKSEAYPGNDLVASGGGTRLDWLGDFISDGFSIGDTIDFQKIDSTGTLLSTHSGTIGSITKNTIILTGSFTPSLANGSYPHSKVRGTTPLGSLIYKFGLIENDENFNPRSKVSQNDQAYYNIVEIGFDGGGGRSTAFVDMEPLGSYKDWVTGTMRARYVSNPNTYTQRYEIEHIFKVVPWYLEGQFSNIQTGIVPELFKGLKTLKYAQEPEFRTSYSNPNSAKSKKLEDIKGSIGWFGQNFNGFNNNYEIVSIAYEDEATTDPADGLLISSKTKVTAIVQKNNGSFLGSDRVGVYVSYLAPEDDYKDKTDANLQENFIEDLAIGNAGGSSVTGSDFITDLTVSAPVGNQITLTFETLYSAAQQSRLANANEPKFDIEIQLGDNTLASASQDRVILIADVGDYDLSADIPGLIEFTKFEHYPQDLNIDASDGYTSLVGFNQSGHVTKFEFNLDLSKDAYLQGLEYQVLAYNSLTGESFELDTFVINADLDLVSEGSQQIEIDTTRGYALADGDQFNLVQITTGSKVGDKQYYSGYIGQKMTWQKWLSNLNVDTIFYDKDEPNNNLNFKASNYSGLNDYDIVVALKANVFGSDSLGRTGVTPYRHKSPSFTIYDYLKDGNEPPEWIPTIKTYTENGTDLEGYILPNAITKFQIEYENQLATPTTVDTFFGIQRIQPSLDPSFDIPELSSIRPFPINNPVIPEVGEDFLKLEIDGDNIITKGLIDYTKLDGSPSYYLSGEIRDPNFINLTKITFQTNNDFSVDGTFDPSITKATGMVGSWDLGDGSPIQNTNNVSYSGYIDSTIKTVCLTLDDPELVSLIDFNNDQIYGELDISKLTVLTDGIILNLNEDLTSVIYPVITEAMTIVTVTDCDITGNYDISNLSGAGGVVAGDRNSNMTSITFPTSSNPITKLSFLECNLTGTVDMSSLTGLGGEVKFSNQVDELLTTIINPVSSEVINIYDIRFSGISGNINMSGLTALEGEVYLSKNGLLTSVSYPVTSGIFTILSVTDCDITGNYDMSNLTGLGGIVAGDRNNNMTSISLPTSSQVVTRFSFTECNLTGALDLSGLSKLSGEIYLNDQIDELLTTIINPTSYENINVYHVNDSGLTGNLNLSTLSKLGGSIFLARNSGLTSVTYPSSPRTTTLVSVTDCDITGNYDMSNLTGLGGIVAGDRNNNMTSISLPTSSQVVTRFSFTDCDLGYIDFTSMPNITNVNNCDIQLGNNSMLATEVDQIFIDLDSISSTQLTWTRTIALGGTNAAPTATSLSARNSLIAKGITLIHN